MNKQSTHYVEVVTKRLFSLADQVDWTHLPQIDRSQYYDQWATDPALGGELEKVMPQNKVRVYIKDSIMGNYSQHRDADLLSILASMEISYQQVTKKFIQPQAVLCDQVDLYTLSAATRWKIGLMNCFERGANVKRIRTNKIFFVDHTTGRFVDEEYRLLINGAARRLGIDPFWLA